MYGRPPGNDDRPGTVTAAARITQFFSSVATVVLAFFSLAVLGLVHQGGQAYMYVIVNGELASRRVSENSDDAFSVVAVLCFLLTAWPIVACVLAHYVKQRMNAARILLVISALLAAAPMFVFPPILVGWIDPFGIPVGFLAAVASMVACPAVVILLFTGGANAWYAGRRRY
jgi:hypothetical protein